MADRIERKAFVQQLATRMQTDEHVASEWLEATLETLYANFKEGRGVTLKGFGGFEVEGFVRLVILVQGQVVVHHQ